ncbi:TRAP transporter small permease subunit [Litoreibacter janthinus]|uniref:TRAP transporter small permease protein n=1 Tax=Litoreibacter janthinus TaxID=670154 RepID=A0A1I6G7N8_9RHOB|nr:TRAP transporter small permease subunit [Litoreibacter janthinus]SFR38204.1 TRAP-type mannitol/chloroaromatic compound transport system, small permease component [Litoreibacter janthinus]
MSGESVEFTGGLDDVSIAITDPGDVDREHHGWADRLVINVGNVVSWLFPLLMVGIVAQVVMRQNGFNQAWLDDAQWWMYGFAMLTGFAYAITTQSHVRVDILHQNYSPEKRARIEVFAIGWLLMPFLLIMTDILSHYAWSSIEALEGSDSPNGLHRLYLLKASLPLMFVVALIAAWGVFKRNIRVFSDLSLHKVVLWTLPATLFFLTRVIHYGFFWFYAMTTDMKSRQITKEDVFSQVGIYAFAIVVLLIVIGFVLSRRNSKEA